MSLRILADAHLAHVVAAARRRVPELDIASLDLSG